MWNTKCKNRNYVYGTYLWIILWYMNWNIYSGAKQIYYEILPNTSTLSIISFAVLEEFLRKTWAL